MAQLPETIKDLEGKWMALDKSSYEVLHSAETLHELREKTAGGAFSEEVMFFKVPALDVNYIPTI